MAGEKDVIYRGLAGFCSAILLTVVAMSASAEKGTNYYRWINEKGNPEYSQTPPPKGVDYQVESTTSSMVRKVSADEGAVPAETAPTVSNDFEQSHKKNQQVTKNPESCRRARSNLETLDRGTQIRIRDQNGDPRILDEDEKQAHRQKALDTIAVHCDG
jgi:hypothetical protein